jgi:hypothetical protein
MSQPNEQQPIIGKATNQLRTQLLAEAFLNCIDEQHSYTEIFNALSQVLVTQLIGSMLDSGSDVNEPNMIVEFKKFINLSSAQGKWTLQQPELLKRIKEYKEAK